MDPRIWPVILIVVMALLVVLELLTPSMGALTLGALAAAVGSVALGFRHSPSFGYLMLAANVGLLPLTFWLGLHFMKRGPLMLHHELTQDMQPKDAPPLSRLLGQEGVTLTPLRPSGAAMFEQAKVQVVARGCFVEPNTRVKVIHVGSNRVVVEPVLEAKA